MSDDRFKDARRSLMDEDEEGEEEESTEAKTALVDLDELQAQRQKKKESESDDAPQQPASNESSDASQKPDPTPQQNQESDEAASTSGSESSSPDDFDEIEFESLDDSDEEDSIQIGGTSEEESVEESSGGQQEGGQIELGDSSDDLKEGKTDFINAAKFADQADEGETLAPEDESSGYSGNTQFVSVDELQEGAAKEANPKQAILDDEGLQNSYNFTEENIYPGEITVVFAKNFTEDPVVLRQIWEGDVSAMPKERRERVKQLNQLEHPNLVGMNGMIATETGAWAEFDEPEGYRLSAVLDEFGSQPEESVVEWIEQIADVLGLIHEQGFTYANLDTDAVWVQEDNTIQIEPFDILKFSQRGDLGSFGPPEMTGDAESDAELGPTADIFSLGMIGVVAATGEEAVVAADSIEEGSLAEVLKQAVAEAPEERFVDTDEFLEALQKGGGIEFDLGSRKVLYGGVAALVLLGGVFFFLQSGGGNSGSNAGGSTKKSAIAASDKPGERKKPKKAKKKKKANNTKNQKGAEKPSAQAQGNKKKAPPSGKSAAKNPPNMPIKVTRSYKTNPPKGTSVANRKNSKADSKLRKEFEKVRKEAENAKSQEQKLEKYKETLTVLTKLIRRQGRVNKKDREAFDKIVEKSYVSKFLQNLRGDVHKAFDEGEFGMARRNYQTWGKYDYRATARRYFSENRTPKIRQLKPEAVSDE